MYCLILIPLVEGVVLKFLCVHPDQRVNLSDFCLKFNTFFYVHYEFYRLLIVKLLNSLIKNIKTFDGEKAKSLIQV